MPSHSEYTHPINVRSSQLEMQTREVRMDDYEDKIRQNQLQLELVQKQQEQLEREKQLLETLTLRKREFLSQQVELTEKMSNAITLIDRELNEMREELGHLEQCRVCFADHLDKIQTFDPTKWSNEVLNEKLDKATAAIDLAADEYDLAANYFQNSRVGAIFGKASKGRIKKQKVGRSESEFYLQFTNGLAFNLPILILGAFALLVVLFK